MTSSTPTTTESKPRSCCSGKKNKPTELKSETLPKVEITPIIIKEVDEEVPKGCQCCSSNNTEPESDAIDDGRPQPVVTNFRCACGTFRGCCWGTCYPGCKCPGM